MPSKPIRPFVRSLPGRARQLGLAVALAVAILPRSAAADDKEAARTHFNRGVQLYHGKNLDGALAEFRRAHELVPSYRVLFNIGQLQFELREWSAALRTFERYLAEAGEGAPPDKRATVLASIEHCRERVAHLTVKVEHAGEVTLDEVPIGTGPLDTEVVVDPGKHRLTLVPRDGATVTRALEVASGDHVFVELAPTPEPSEAAVQASAPASPAPTATPERRSSSPPPSRTPAWLSLGTTAVLAAGTVAGALVANNAQRALERRLDSLPLDDAAVRDRRADVKTASLVTDVLGVATLLGGVVTTYFFIAGSSGRTARSVDVAVGPSSVGVVGTFH